MLVRRELSLLVDLECEAPANLHLGPLQFEVRSRPFALKVIPSVGEQDATRVMRPFRSILFAIHANRVSELGRNPWI